MSFLYASNHTLLGRVLVLLLTLQFTDVSTGNEVCTMASNHHRLDTAVLDCCLIGVQDTNRGVLVPTISRLQTM